MEFFSIFFQIRLTDKTKKCYYTNAMSTGHKTEVRIPQPTPFWGTWAKPVVNSNSLSLSYIEETYQKITSYTEPFFQGEKSAPSPLQAAGRGGAYISKKRRNSRKGGLYPMGSYRLFYAP
jgi:hypothetical protein